MDKIKKDIQDLKYLLNSLVEDDLFGSRNRIVENLKGDLDSIETIEKKARETIK